MNAFAVAAGCLLLALLLAGQFVRRRRPNMHHRQMMRQADRALALLSPAAGSRPGSIIAYIRKMHPHAVEEFVLGAAERAGHRVVRNERYVGDGGVDGRIEVSGVMHLVQTKRYSSAIRPEHVRSFSEICRRRRMPGLFVHFGRTGPLSRELCDPSVTIISGRRLVDLIGGKPIVIPTPGRRRT